MVVLLLSVALNLYLFKQVDKSSNVKDTVAAYKVYKDVEQQGQNEDITADNFLSQMTKVSNADGKSFALKGNQASAASCKQLVRYVINAFKNSDQYWESGDYSLYNAWFDNAVGLYEQGVNQGCWSPV
ncbi:hypothetical protein A2814_01815 [Candidatus Nomurabacteria bacterium RIFCSPHIGHO2_01_FULL_38_19]|uniref:Uncharacterized protein n=1 Tax=Candidatus Nomurabacteria bacterium RIFCSPHIGHO2_01_FULL_38_19 TaxID=1801732 RepID=A0A1F6UUX6_9BACT|nr:MAG: hypothetical protein A2814_01815 [Candidatus Nomurabacteria bacterium RIFCSPHIGHO2_01_FULL_38_19]